MQAHPRIHDHTLATIGLETENQFFFRTDVHDILFS